MLAAVGAGRLLAEVDQVPVSRQIVVALEFLITVQTREVSATCKGDTVLPLIEAGKKENCVFNLLPKRIIKASNPLRPYILAQPRNAKNIPSVNNPIEPGNVFVKFFPQIFRACIF
jgi:hypothetical protein